MTLPNPPTIDHLDLPLVLKRALIEVVAAALEARAPTLTNAEFDTLADFLGGK